jgi:hypothetical protein
MRWRVFTNISMEGSSMKSMHSFSFIWAVLLTALAVVPTSAHAQSAAGRFTLPSEAHWGRAVLPAGDYSYSIGYAGASTLVYVRGANGSPGAMILASSIVAADDYSGHSRLLLTRKGDTLFVTSLHLPTLGLVMDFPTPGSETRTRSLAMAREHPGGTAR